MGKDKFPAIQSPKLRNVCSLLCRKKSPRKKFYSLIKCARIIRQFSHSSTNRQIKRITTIRRITKQIQRFFLDVELMHSQYLEISFVREAIMNRFLTIRVWFLVIDPFSLGKGKLKFISIRLRSTVEDSTPY